MRITQEADYALRIVCHLAAEQRYFSAKEIAERVGVPSRFTQSILRKLLDGGILVSRQGAGGGYAFSASPETVTMRNVIEQIEGPIAISKCFEDGHVCSRAGSQKADCMLHAAFRHISDVISAELERITIAQLISGQE